MKSSPLLAEIRALSPEAKARLRWRLQARPNQLTPPGDWAIWLVMAGRGFGKTRIGAEDFAEYGMENPDSRLAIVAPTFSDARDTCVEGVSGLLSCLPQDVVKNWNRSIGELFLTNGTRYRLFSADEPQRLRGPQHHRAWVDELAAFRYPETWDQLMFGLRLGTLPQVIVTTTPRPIPLVRQLKERVGKDVILTVGNTWENSDNLAPAALASLKERYEGTRLGRQELYAEILDDVPGALWTLAIMDAARVGAGPDTSRLVVSVDPSGGHGEDNDAQGIVVVAKGIDGHGYVVDDRTCKLTPEGWGRRVVNAYHEHQADRVIAEKNYGGEMVEHVIHSIDKRVPVKLVSATRGKRVRAEPVSALYEQGKMHHVGVFPELEDEMVTWVPDAGMPSPNRMDALVWGVTELMVQETGFAFLGAA